MLVNNLKLNTPFLLSDRFELSFFSCAQIEFTYNIIIMTGRVSGTGPKDSGWLRGQRSQDSRRASQVHHEGEL